MKIKTVSKLFGKTSVSLAVVLALLAGSIALSGARAAGVPAVAAGLAPLPPTQTVTFNSIAADDGWILESTETSQQGLTTNSAATTVLLGDNFERKQYRSILSFSTSSLPDTAVITAVTLKVKQHSIVGTGNPITLLGGFKVDVKTGPLGAVALQPADFQVAATATYGPLNYTFADSWYSLNLNNTKEEINILSSGGGLTQMRLRFTTDDNGDNLANYLALYSGDGPTASEPQLVVQYYDSATATPTMTATATSTATSTATATRTSTATVTVTSTASPTGTMTGTATATRTSTATGTATATQTATSTPTNTVGASSTVTPTATGSQTWTPTATSTSTATVTQTETLTLDPTHTATGTSTATLESTATETETATATLSPTVTLTLAHTSTPTQTATATASATAVSCGSTNIALSKPATALSTLGGNTASKAVDGNTGTRWESVHNVDPQWLQIDLGSPQSICRVKLNWEGAYASGYQIQVSEDGSTWNTIFSTTTGNGAIDDLTGLSGIGRYIRMYGTTRALPYGYSLWEMDVYVGTPPTLTPTPTGPTVTPTVTLTPTITPTPTITNTPINPNDCGTSNMAINRPVTVSSGTGASNAVDGFSGTRWESAQGVDPQWIRLDFGSPAIICRVVLNWEVAAASAYQLQTSNDGTNWTTIYSVVGSGGGLQDLNVEGLGRYLRMYGTARTTPYGYSLWEIEVYGSGGDVLPTVTPIPTIQSAPVDFGPRVVIFDPSMSTSTIQDRLNLVFSQQQSNQFGTQRDALLFKPGTYSVSASIGFNTQISGLGMSPDDVVINGLVNAEADWFGDNATQNFWRIAENMKVNPTGGTNRWAVSQAAPFRRMHIAGNLQLDPRNHGWSSGGYLADTKVTGQVQSGSQQQYMSRNSQIGSWSNCVWNCLFLGTSGAPSQSFPTPPYTTIGQTPSVREKPFLYVDGNGDYFVFVPAMRSNASGTSWDGQTPAGTSLPISQFYIVKEGATAADINNALALGKDLLVTPGVYHLNQTINITRADTVVLGLGLATFINDGGIVAMHVDDVDGVKIAGLLFDAGTTNAPTLLEVGGAGASASHSSNPTQLSDVFVRVGGAIAGKVTAAVTINSDDVIIDHTWIWRGDHGAGIGWTVNTSDNGIIINGDNVTIYGLFVEHFQKYNVVWNGNGGRTYFFQNELPYDAPNQAAYMNGAIKGWAAYKVADTVTTHEAWALGSYCYFNVDPTIQVDHSFEVPDIAGVIFHDLLTISLGNNGTILHVINNTGAVTSTTTSPSNVISYP